MGDLLRALFGVFFEGAFLRLPPLVALVVANLIPLVGVIFLGWNLAQVMVLYWLETGIIGLFNVAKLVLVARWKSLWVVPFFLIHFGLFMGVQLVFLLVFFVGTGASLDELWRRVYLAAIPLFVSHWISFFTYFVGTREYRRVNWSDQMTAPYARVMVTQFSILALGGILLFFRSVPVGGVAFLVVLKTLLDFASHVSKYRGQRAPRPGCGSLRIVATFDTGAAAGKAEIALTRDEKTVIGISKRGSGECRFQDLPAGTYQVAAVRGDGVPMSIEIVAGRETAVPLRVPRA